MAPQQTAKVTNFKNLRRSMHAIVGGKPVRCIAYGDVEGNSPSYLCVNTDGSSTWESLNKVAITDTNFLPIAQDALQAAGSRR